MKQNLMDFSLLFKQSVYNPLYSLIAIAERLNNKDILEDLRNLIKYIMVDEYEIG